MQQIEYIVYKESGQWVVNDNGFLTKLPHWIKTKEDVKNYITQYNDNPEITITVTFA